MRSFCTDVRGNIAVLTALLAPMAIAMAGGAIDFYRWSDQRSSLKEVTEMLATRGAREFLLANTTEAQIRSILNAAVANGVAEPYGLDPFTLEIDVDMDATEVAVTAAQPPKPGMLLTKFSPFKENVRERSVAVARGGVNVCVVALETSANEAVAARINANLDAEDCAIYANSTGPSAIVSRTTSRMTAALICSAGGYGGGLLNYSQDPLTDCPVYDDPLAERTPPIVGACDHTDMRIGEDFLDLSPDEDAPTRIGGVLSGVVGGTISTVEATLTSVTETLSPGVYCGGLKIGSNAAITLDPGVYVIKDGSLEVSFNGELQGTGVSFYLVGDDATFFFDAESKIELSASETGQLAGILFFEDRMAPADRQHRIFSDDARELIGTFYLPRGELVVASLLPVADQSAYTAIVAKKLSMTGSPTLVLNTDYGATSVPVPAGVGATGGTTFLRE